MELRFHPENPFNKPLCGDVAKRAGLLLSIKVRRSKRNPNKPPQFVVKILGYTTKSFTFESVLYFSKFIMNLIQILLFSDLCDFQYLPFAPDPKENSGELKMALDSIVPRSVIDLDYYK